MEKADGFAINELGIPSIVLMENAAQSVFRYFCSLNTAKDSTAVVAGGGNNGGDGIALTRLLLNAGFKVDLFIASAPEKLKGDPLINYTILCKMGYEPFFINSEKPVPCLEKYDVIFDSLFGTGLSRSLEGWYSDIVDSINASSGYVIAIDIPSGLSGMTHNILGNAVKARSTVTFCRPKIPHAMYPAKKLCGHVEVCGISIPDIAVRQTNCKISMNCLENLPKLPERRPDSHKGNFGHSCIIGGSEGKTGAAIMASLSCMRTGSGLTTCILPKETSVSADFFPELMSCPIGSKTYFEMKDAEECINFLKDKTAAAIGSGIGRDKNTADFVNLVAKETKIPLIIDADGINLLEDDTFKFLKNRAVLTPHIGEFSRLINKTTEDVLADRLELASKFAVEKCVVLVLKSADTIIALPDGTCTINNTGNSSLSKGGSGDCLAGIITALAAQKMSLENAAKAGTWLLGKAAEKTTENIYIASVLTTDVINNIPKVMHEVC